MKNCPLGFPDSIMGRYEREGYWKNLTLGEHLRQWASRYATRIAVVDGEELCSYGELDRRVDRMVAGLVNLGIVCGDCVLLQLPNSLQFVISLFALFRLGAVPLLAMPAQRLSELDDLCTQAEPVAYIVPQRFLGFEYGTTVESLRSKHPTLRHIIIDGDDTRPYLALRDLESNPIQLAAEPQSRHIALLLQSGGTTGTPKLIPRTHADYAYNAQASAALCELNGESVYLAALPIAHNFPLACPGVLGILSAGGRVVMARTPASDEAFSLIVREKVSITALVPQLIPLWLQAREWDQRDLSSLKLLQVGGARLDARLARQIPERLGCNLQQVFGMAEGLLCYTRPGDSADVIFNTQGRPLSPLDEVRIVDEAGEDVAAGEVGELLTRGPYTIRGYYRAEIHNKTAFTVDGFYRSGDLVRQTPAGNLVVEGRRKEQINRAGEKIAATEIEQQLRLHPAITDVAVVAVPDKILGERSCAFLLEGNDVPDLRTVHDFLRARGLPRYKLPDQLEVTPKWPLTNIGKIDKKQLIKRAQNAACDSVPRDSFHEQTLTVVSSPLLLAIRLVQELDAESFVVYERGGEWSIGIGVAAEVTLTQQQIAVGYENQHQQWPLTDFSKGIAQALDALPMRGWRLYGTANFELARIFHGLPFDGPMEPLLSLVVPVTEVRLSEGKALLRVKHKADLSAWSERLCRLDALDADENILKRSVALDVRQSDASAYMRCVAAAIKQIRAGEYSKVILSRSISLEKPVSIVHSYFKGRMVNQPARSFLLRRRGLSSAGFSPETVVEVSSEGQVSTQPLAGTRALGADAAEEARLRAELLSDPKEIAEHAVSVKLAFEELVPICAPESVRVDEFMQVCRRGTVQHLGSRVSGHLAEGKTSWDAFRSLFPAVTASGIPKRQAIEAIGLHEIEQRGLYSGCVMIADSDGSLDAALVLRSLYQKNGRAWLRAGAGIVAMSTPEREFEETCEKLVSVSRYLVGIEVRV